MKKLVFSLAILSVGLFSIDAMAQDAQKAAADVAKAYMNAPKIEEPAPKPNYWTTSLTTNLNFIQTSYVNWAKGGNNNYSMDIYVDANANYKKDAMYWNNRLQLDYGFLYSQDKPILQKNKDRILLESTWGHKITNTLNYSAKFIFLSQFTNGYDYNTPTGISGSNGFTKKEWLDARRLKSGFFSPADITLGLGIDWIPTSWFKLNFAPLTGGVKIVSDPLLRKNYGMEKLADNSNNYKNHRFQLGTQLTMDGSLNINDNFGVNTQLILFSDYLNHPLIPRVNWTNRFSWKLAKYFNLVFQTDLIYDHDVLIVTDKHPEGVRRVQFTESFKFGFTYTFASKTK